MEDIHFDAQEIIIHDINEDTAGPGYRGVNLMTNRGHIACRLYQAPGAPAGAVWVGGAGGGWDTPARGMYPRLCEDFMGESITSLRVRFRNPTALKEATFDVLAGIQYLETLGITSIRLTGHSFGGAVVIQAAANGEIVRTVVTLATQGYGVQPAARLGPRCSILAVHGLNDEVLPTFCSEYTYQLAEEPRRLKLYAGARHGLDEVAGELYQLVRDWMTEQLGVSKAVES